MLTSQQQKKGVSPLIATVLLIVFAIAIASVLLSWLGNYTSDTTERAQATSDDLLDCSRQGVQILRVVANSTDNIARVDVQSIGQDTVTVSDVLVLSTSGTQCDFASSSAMSPGNITAFTASCSITCTTFDSVQVGTTCGGVGDSFSGNTTVIGC